MTLKQIKPRSKNKHRINAGLLKMYKSYKKRIHPEYQVDKDTFKAIIKAFNLASIDLIINESKTLKLPSNLGDIEVRRTMPRFSKYARAEKELANLRLPIDWAETRKQGKTVKHINAHTNGAIYRVRWRKVNIWYLKLYRFISSRNITRPLAQKLKEGFIDYFR